MSSDFTIRSDDYYYYRLNCLMWEQEVIFYIY